MQNKTCTQCKESKPLLSFRKKGNGTSSKCKECTKVYAKQHYEQNKEKYATAAKESRKRILQENRIWVRSLKSVPCKDCYETYPYYVMDFDHVRGEKKANVSDLVRGFASRRKIQEEIDKCDIVCAVCHRIRTFTRGE